MIPYFAESGGTKILYDALKSQSFEQLTDFLKYILDEEKKIPIDIQKFMEPKPWNIFRNDFNQIAFDAGHLTLEKIGNNFFLKATNQEMRENFSKLINEHFFKNQNYDTLFHNFEKHDLRGFFNSLESIVFQNKSILNLKDRNPESLKQAKYEVFLHQACSIAILEMLIYAKDKKKFKIMSFSMKKSFSKAVFSLT